MREAQAAAQRAMSELQARLEREGAQSSDRPDLFDVEQLQRPGFARCLSIGERIHGGNKKSACGGELDVDANVRAETRKPVENVFGKKERPQQETIRSMSITTKSIRSVRARIPPSSKSSSLPAASLWSTVVNSQAGTPSCWSPNSTCPPEERGTKT